jgi:hypothetical protein
MPRFPPRIYIGRSAHVRFRVVPALKYNSYIGSCSGIQIIQEEDEDEAHLNC